jgi:ubiquinone/menaquinone biosynthesis C-methylase UbiE
MKDYENIANNIIKKIYPYLITDLKNFYNQSLDNKIIVELGTGPGHILEELLKEKFKYIYGIDISLEMLLRAKIRNNNNKRLQLINANVENIPLKEKSIDLIISRGSVFFWKNLDKAFREIYRVLKKDGFLLIGGGYGISTPDNIVEEIINNFKKNISKNDKPKLDIDKTIKIMESIGGKTEVIAKPKHGFWITWKK